MDSARWQRIKGILGEALVLPANARAGFVATTCAGDDALRAEVESLLAGEDSTFMNAPAFVAAAEALERSRETLRANERIGEFRIVRELGRGGMGTVYLAERDDGEFRQHVAVKVVSRGRDTDLVLRRFRQERRILASLEHPNIAQLFSGGTTNDGLPYFVMEYVEGEPIDVYCERRELSTVQRLELFRSVCAAVNYAHQRLVVHRDIKPANILVTADGVPKLLDFGIAKLLDDGGSNSGAEPATTLQALTPAYASPEQRAGTPVTTLTDVYSLGVVLYRLVSGVSPATDAAPARPSEAAPTRQRALVGDVDNIVLMAMRIEPARRYASPAQLSEDIRRHLSGRPVIARADTFRYRATKFVRRNAVVVALGAVATVAVIGGFAGMAWQAQVARQERQLAERRFGEVRQLATSFLFELDAQIMNLQGATPAREALVRRALLSLDGLARDARDDRALLGDLAAAYVRVGDVQGKPYTANLGRSADALVSYRKGAAILERLSVLSPNDATVRRQLARAYQGTSAVEARTGDVDGAIATERRAVALSEALVRSDSLGKGAISDRARTDSVLLADRTLLADCLGWLGRALSQKNTIAFTEEALAAYRRTHAIRVELAADEQQVGMRRYAAGVAGAYEGYALWQLGDLSGDTTYYREALQLLKDSHAINQAMGAAMPSNAQMRRAAVDALREIALLHLKLGEGHDALHDLDQALPTQQSLAAGDTHNAEAQRDLAAVLLVYASAYQGVGDATRADAAALRARYMLERLRAADSTNTDDIANLSRVYEVIGDLQRARGAVDSSLVSYQQASEDAQRWVRLAPTSDGPRRLLAEQEAQLARQFATQARMASSATVRARNHAAQCTAGRAANAQWTAIASHGPLAPADTAAAAAMRRGVEACGV